MSIYPTPELRRNLIRVFRLLAEECYCQRCKERAHLLRRSNSVDAMRYAVVHLENEDHESIQEFRAREWGLKGKPRERTGAA